MDFYGKTDYPVRQFTERHFSSHAWWNIFQPLTTAVYAPPFVFFVVSKKHKPEAEVMAQAFQTG
jgi:hypothetical protein